MNEAFDSGQSSALERPVFLRPDTKIEPLVSGWYAWNHLIPPLQRAMNITYRHIPLLRSFIQNPNVHVAACKDPSLFGGPFVHLEASRLPEVRDLLSATNERQRQLIELARDFKSLDEKLQASASGYSLNEFYSKLPQSLEGMIEFLYDLNNHPKLRVIEEFLYQDYFDPAAFEVAVSNVPESNRPFFMCTPRLKTPSAIRLQMAPSDPRLDLLARMRTSAQSGSEVVRTLGISRTELDLFCTFLTADPPVRSNPEFRRDGVRIRYFGHACVLVQTSATNILVDPMFAWDADKGDGRFTFADLPDQIDYVVISHGHQDHCSPEMLLQLRHRVGCVVVPRNNSGSLSDPSLKLLLAHLGIENTREVGAFAEVHFSDGKITSLPFPGEHVDLDIYSRQGIFIEIRGRRLAFLVDSDGHDPKLFQRIAKRIGPELDALFVGMECHGAPFSWLYGPLSTKAIARRDDESRRLSGLDCLRAQRVLGEFSPAQVYVYAMGQEPWLPYIMGLQYAPESVQLREVAKFLEFCTQLGVPCEHLFISYETELKAL